LVYLVYISDSCNNVAIFVSHAVNLIWNYRRRSSFKELQQYTWYTWRF